MGPPVCQIKAYQKDLAQIETYQHHSKIPKLVMVTGKDQMSAKRINKIYKNY